MDNLKSLFRANRAFLLGLLAFFISMGIYLLITTRANSFIAISLPHSPLPDQLFQWYTNLGDGLFSVFLVLVFLALRRFELALQILLAFLISGLLVQLVKAMVVSPRPKDFFAGMNIVHLIDGVTLGGNASFPSGHSASAFALACSLAFFARHKLVSLVYLVLAILVGYSRVYLGQHFPGDVYGGATIGVFTAIFVYWLIRNYLGQKLEALFARTGKKQE